MESSRELGGDSCCNLPDQDWPLVAAECGSGGQAWHHTAVGFSAAEVGSLEPWFRSAPPTCWWPSVWRTLSGSEQSETLFVMPGTGRLVGWIFCSTQRDGLLRGRSHIPCSPACKVTSSRYPAFGSSVLDRFTVFSRGLDEMASWCLLSAPV